MINRFTRSATVIGKILLPLCLSISFVSHAYQNSMQSAANDLQQTANKRLNTTTEKVKGLDLANDPLAKAKLRVILGQFTQLEGHFSQEIIDMQGELLQASTGNIVLQKPQKLRWTVNAPEESLLIADGNTVYNIDPFVEQVTLIEQSELTDKNPLMLLISDEESQWQAVNVQQTEQGFLLQPSEPDAAITKVILHFDAQQKLSSLTSFDRQQQKNMITFTNVSTNSSVEPSQFTFKTPEGWVVDDQRNVK